MYQSASLLHLLFLDISTMTAITNCNSIPQLPYINVLACLSCDYYTITLSADDPLRSGLGHAYHCSHCCRSACNRKTYLRCWSSWSCGNPDHPEEDIYCHNCQWGRDTAAEWKWRVASYGDVILPGIPNNGTTETVYVDIDEMWKTWRQCNWRVENGASVRRFVEVVGFEEAEKLAELMDFEAQVEALGLKKTAPRVEKAGVRVKFKEVGATTFFEGLKENVKHIGQS